MITVEQFLQFNSRSIFSLKPENKVIDSLFLMAEKNIGCILIISHGQLLGIFSERDYARKVVLKGRTSNEALVKDIMTAQVITVESMHNMEQCMQIMTDLGALLYEYARR